MHRQLPSKMSQYFFPLYRYCFCKAKSCSKWPLPPSMESIMLHAQQLCTWNTWAAATVLSWAGMQYKFYTNKLNQLGFSSHWNEINLSLILNEDKTESIMQHNIETENLHFSLHYVAFFIFKWLKIREEEPTFISDVKKVSETDYRLLNMRDCGHMHMSRVWGEMGPVHSACAR